MSDQTVCVAPATVVSSAIEIMLDEGVKILFVVDPPNRVVGTLTEGALLGAAVDSQLSRDPVSLHMTRQFVSIGKEVSLEMLVDQFILHRVSHLPVVQDGQLIGIVSRRDVLRAVFGEAGPARLMAAMLG